jgi:uncharacterized protein
MRTRQTRPVQDDPATSPQETPKRKRGPQPGTPAARHGGMAVRDKYGLDYYSKIGSKGGKTVRERQGPDFFANIGRMSGQTTRDMLGLGHYERIGRLGGLRSRKREQEMRQQDGS